VIRTGSNQKTLLLYITLATVVAAAAAVIVIHFAFLGVYSLNVTVNTNTTGRIYPYQTSRFAITVKNTGASQINDLILGFYMNGTELQHYTITVPSHESVTLRYNYTYTTGGPFDFQAVADPGSLLNIANRSNAQSGVLVKVSAPEIPNVYKSVPNSGISETQSFTMSGTGMYSTEALAQAYELKVVNNMFGSLKSVMTKLFGNLYGFVADDALCLPVGVLMKL
jgi:subtilase family serine protease